MPHREFPILIVDDQPQGRMIVAQILRALHYGYLEEASSGQEALDRLEMNDPAFPYKAVFCDLFMPRMNGLELLIACRTRPELEKVSFIMVASKGDQATIQSAIEAGADDYILKPFSNETIAQVDRKLRKLAARGGRNRPLFEAQAPAKPHRMVQDRFILEMGKRTGLSSVQLEGVIRFLIQSFGQRVRPDVAVQLASQIPAEFEGMILNAPGGPNASITEPFLLKGLVAMCGVPEAQAEAVLRGFCRGLRALMDPQAREIFFKALPEGLLKFYME